MRHRSAHFALDLRDRLAELQFNRMNRRGDRFDLDMIEELEAIVIEIASLNEIDILVIRGGWDVDLELESLLHGDLPISARNLAIRGQQLLQQIEKLGERIQTIAWIEGACRGVGLELALACKTRVGVQRPGNVFRFDYAEKALLPSWGGVQRLGKQVGASKTRSLLSRATTLSLVEAEHIGLVHHVFSVETPEIKIRQWIESAREKTSESPLFRFWNKLGRSVRNLGGKRDVTPASEPYLRAMHGVLAASRVSVGEGLAAERNAFESMTETVAYRNANRLRRIASRRSDISLASPSLVGVVGETTEAIEFALFLANQETEVVLYPGHSQRESNLNARLHEAIRPWLRRGFCSESGGEAIIGRIRVVESWDALSEVAWLLEATRGEEFDLCELYSRLSECLSRTAILSPVRPRVSVGELQQGFPSPERIVGLDGVESFLDGRLVELLSGSETDDASLRLVADWFGRWDRTAIPLPSGSASVSRRLRSVYFSEAIHLIAEGMPPEKIDREMRRRGTARGPLESIDRVGFDEVASWVDETISHTDIVNLRMEGLRSLGWNGKSNREGFYRYGKGSKWENEIARMVLWRSQEDDCTQQYVFDADEALEAGVDRLLLRVANEVGKLLEEGVEVDQLDLISAWGLKLITREGGILTYADSRGLSAVQDRLLEFCDRFGKRFEPCEELQRRVDAGELFGSDNPFSASRPIRRAG